MRLDIGDRGGAVLKCSFSPDGKLVACAAAYRLVVRDVETLEIVHIFSCKDVVEKIEWSRDSKYVLCGIFKRGLAQVWSVEQPEWYCNVDEGPIGLSCVRFSPGGRHVLATADVPATAHRDWDLSNDCQMPHNHRCKQQGRTFTESPQRTKQRYG